MIRKFLPSRKKQTSTSKKNKELEDTAKAIQTIIESGYSSHHRVYKVNFIRGLFFGLGSAVGATVIVAGLVGLLSLFDEIPLVCGLVDAIKNSINSN